MTAKDFQLLTYLQTYLTPERHSKIERIASARTQYITLVLEDVYRDRNEGAIIRTCDCFGVQNLHMIDSRIIPKVTHAIARGAEKWITQHRYGESESNQTDATQQCLSNLRNKGYRIVATTPHKKGVSIEQLPLEKPAAFVFGTEVRGISERIVAEADEFVYLPMMGFSESYNVSVAAAVLLQHVTQRLKSSSIPWQLSENQKNQLKLEWTKKSIKTIDSLLINFEKKYAQLNEG